MTGWSCGGSSPNRSAPAAPGAPASAPQWGHWHRETALMDQVVGTALGQSEQLSGQWHRVTGRWGSPAFRAAEPRGVT